MLQARLHVQGLGLYTRTYILSALHIVYMDLHIYRL